MTDRLIQRKLTPQRSEYTLFFHTIVSYTLFIYLCAFTACRKLLFCINFQLHNQSNIITHPCLFLPESYWKMLQLPKCVVIAVLYLHDCLQSITLFTLDLHVFPNVPLVSNQTPLQTERMPLSFYSVLFSPLLPSISSPISNCVLPRDDQCFEIKTVF